MLLQASLPLQAQEPPLPSWLHKGEMLPLARFGCINPPSAAAASPLSSASITPLYFIFNYSIKINKQTSSWEEKEKSARHQDAARRLKDAE